MSTTTVESSDRDHYQAELNFLSELCAVTASSTDLRPILDWIVQKTTAMFTADEGSIKLSGPDTGPPTAKTLIRKHQPGLDSGSWETPIVMSVMGYLMVKNEGLASKDILDDERFPALRRTQSRVRAVLAVPLRVENRITGMLAVTNRAPGREWTSAETRLLHIIAAHSAQAIEQARLRAESEERKRLQEEKEKMERELNLARDIQMSLVPSKPMVSGPWEVHGLVVPARQVGGDYYDYFPLGEGRFGITIADVSGKGVPASLLMSNVQASLRAFCDGNREVIEAIRMVNKSVSRAASGGKFITLFYGEVDTQRNVLRYTNAGHNYPMLRRRDGAVEELTSGGLLLGLFEDATYELGEIAFAPGDSLLLYSDGISEASDSRGHLFGEDRLRALWQTCCTLPSGQVIGCLLKDVETFRGSAGQSDDMTALVVGPRNDG
ncbi:MAG TPA: GAF domain-containing SpoIIE family protein phosphatase [Candidatus Eisenbacteria bacterium]|nr:GAF domain-containing SpoIIE family protein phosphatase [Candidatus Eisenbacteria bacterium]